MRLPKHRIFTITADWHQSSALSKLVLHAKRGREKSRPYQQTGEYGNRGITNI